MMTMNEKTPIWLHLKKEYIDDNIDDLLKYLQEKSKDKSKDSFYETTIELLRQRVRMLLDDLASVAIYTERQDVESTLFNVRLLAAYLLVEPDTPLSTTAYTAFMNVIRELHPKWSERTIKVSIERLKHAKVTSMGYTWSDLSGIGTEFFAEKACSFVRFGEPLTTPLLFSLHGTAIVTSDSGLLLSFEDRKKAKKLLSAGVKSLDTGMGIALFTSPSAKLKQSLEADPVAIDKYLKDFVTNQQMQSVGNGSSLKSYEDGESLVVKISNIDARGTIYVETVDARYHVLVGTVEWDHSNWMYYHTGSLYKMLRVGDYLHANLISADKATFSIEKQLVAFFVEDTKKAMVEEEGDVFLCKLIDTSDSRKKFGWISEYGVAFYTERSEQYAKGDFAMLKVKYFGKDQYYGWIEAEILEDYEKDDIEGFDEQSVRAECIRAFAENTAIPEAEVLENGDGDLDSVVLSMLLHQLYEYQKKLLKPSERLCFLANSLAMAEMLGDTATASFLRFENDYLRLIVQFANGKSIESWNLYPAPEYKGARATSYRIATIDLLKEYGKTENSEKLANAASQFEGVLPEISRLARLIQAVNSMQGVLPPASVNVIRHEIIKTLSLEAENNVDLESESTTFFGIESGTVEFKTSMVYPPDSQMQPDETRQNYNVMKAICAFLNSDLGGKLYIGVNDQGCAAGIQEDMKYLKFSTIDAYNRYVQDTAVKYFGKDVLPYLIIDAHPKDLVLEVTVKPHPYRLVELNGEAYERFNAESRKIDEDERKKIIDKKVFRNEDRLAIISLLQHAETLKKCVVLHRYASSNSGNVHDRKVEAYDVRPEDGLVIAFDYNSGEPRVFNINRIGFVEILENENWKHTSSHEEIKVDVFHMSGTKPVHVSLQLDLMAKNLLVEEFPAARDFIHPNKNDKNIWYFDADVYSMDGIGRFFIGLADHIKISEGEELKEHIRNYIHELGSRNW